MDEQNPTRNDGGWPQALPTITIKFDPARQQPTVTWENISNFEYALALVHMAKLMIEQQRRIASLQQVKILPGSTLPIALPGRVRS